MHPGKGHSKLAEHGAHHGPQHKGKHRGISKGGALKVDGHHGGIVHSKAGKGQSGHLLVSPANVGRLGSKANLGHKGL